MMKKVIWFSVVIIALQVIAAWIILPMLPPEIPIHWGISGQPDGWGSNWMIFMPPAISLGMVLLMVIMPKFDPLGKNVMRAEKAYSAVIGATVGLMTVLFVVTTMASLGMSVAVDRVIMVAIGVLFVIIGNYLPKTKRSFIFGIRMPWTLLNDEVWAKTHRFGGKMFMSMGVLFLLGWNFPVPWNFIVPMSGVFAGMAIITVYAYRTYKKVVTTDLPQK